MTDQREHLSAGIDGELSAEELRFLLRRIEHDPQLRVSWGRYHLARDALRRQLPAVAGDHFAGRVAAAIERQAAVPAGRTMPRWLRWSAGGAVAAGVAVAALMLSQPGNERSAAPALADTSQSQAVAASADATLASSRPASTPAAVPPWLSASNASFYSQEAAATLEPTYDVVLPYTRELARYRVQQSGRGDRPGVYLPQAGARPPAERSPHRASIMQ